MSIFPEGLLEWAGYRSGGVRRLFDEQSGRPSRELIRTGLIDRLVDWAKSVSENRPSVPKVVLLVGGPGNGKTEAIEACIRQLDASTGSDGRLTAQMSKLFAAGTGLPMPRLARVEVARGPRGNETFHLEIVQDASVTDAELPGLPPSQLLLRDLERVTSRYDANIVYLACVNRGVLDEALSASIDSGSARGQEVLDRIVRAVGLTSDAGSAWPLSGEEAVAVWPMDVDSLLVPVAHDCPPPAKRMLEIATAEQDWPKANACSAGESCPFCTSRRWLDDSQTKDSVLRLLRWYELASGKRWSFRDLASLLSYLLARTSQSPDLRELAPCNWAARQIDLDAKRDASTSAQNAQAFFLLVGALYQHALFADWPKSAASSLKRDLRELGLERDPTLLGLQTFLGASKRRSLPATLEPQLTSLCILLDPALADPDQEFEVSARTSVRLREFDARFSQSVAEGLAFARHLRILTPLEVELLRRLAQADQSLSDVSIRNRRPLAATRVQATLRDFACRLVRRSIGVHVGICRDADILAEFERVIESHEAVTHVVVKQVQSLLNQRENFTTSLNTTFGEPLPPPARRATLTTAKQIVRPTTVGVAGRPKATLRFLSVGSKGSRQSVPLTFDLFKSIRELDQGMLEATLPRTVLALLDTTKARLSGRIVRDEDALDGAEMSIGLREERIVRELGKFHVRRSTGS